MFKKKEKKIYKWKFLREGLKSEHGKTVWKLGEWEHEDFPKICNSGFHFPPTTRYEMIHPKNDFFFTPAFLESCIFLAFRAMLRRTALHNDSHC